MSEEKIERFTRRESTYYEKAICRLQELENKLESGELIEIPKIGEKYWSLFNTYLPEQIVVDNVIVKVDKSGTRIYAFNENFADGGLVGEAIFLTRKQAEAYLKSLKETKK